MQAEPGGPEVYAALEREERAEFYIDPSAEQSTHRIVGQVQRLYRAGVVDKFGMLAHSRQPRQFVRASPAALPRALHIANLLCHAFDARHWPMSIDGSQGKEAYEPTVPLRVTVLAQEVRVTIEERSRRTFRPTPQPDGDVYEFLPTGQLALQAYTRATAELADRPTRPPVEQQLNEFCRRVIRVVARANARDAEAKRQAHDLDAAWQRHEDEQNLRQFQAKLVEEIEAQAGQWAKHRRITEYIAAVREAYAREPHLIAPDQPLGRWLAWADAHVAQTDPRRHRKLDPENPPPVVRQPRPYRR
jgi:hypothetical protein